MKLSKSQLDKKSSLEIQLGTAFGALQTAVVNLNKTLDEERQLVESALAVYNEVVAETLDFTSSIADDAADEWNDRSEKWQDSDAGQEAAEWRNAWEAVDIGELELELPGDLEVDDPEHSTILADLPV